jgi:thiol-disulfide isomerase/thioredoxin
MWRLVLLIGVLGATAGAGLWWRAWNGRVTAAPPAAVGPWAELGFDPGAARATLLQFSSAFCQPCRATRSILADVTQMLPDVQHVEVDAESHLDAVRELHILRTPTVLIIDRGGAVVKRASGQPRKADVIAAVAPLLLEGSPDKPDSETALPNTGTADR